MEKYMKNRSLERSMNKIKDSHLAALKNRSLEGKTQRVLENKKNE